MNNSTKFAPQQKRRKQHTVNYKLIAYFLLLFCFLSVKTADATPQNLTTKNVSSVFQVAKRQVLNTLSLTARNRYPIQTKTTGQWETTRSDGWTSGFFPGILWLLYEQTGNPIYSREAKLRQNNLAPQQFNTSTHDIGFMIFNSFGNSYRLTKNVKDKQTILQSAQTLAKRFDPKVGLIKSWNGPENSYQVIIDNLMNLELLFWSAKNGGDAKLQEIAKTHSKNTARDFVRKDGGTFHLVNYNSKNGRVISRTTAQGFSPNSTWTRGQAWAIYGFAIAYRETGDKLFLDSARKTADYYVKNLPADFIPYWDFDVPNKTKEPRDSSAAAIATAGLLELAKLETNPARSTIYRDTASNTLVALSSGNFLAQNINQSSILLHGTYNKKDGNFDRGTIWGDYYFIEALQKYKALTK